MRELFRHVLKPSRRIFEVTVPVLQPRHGYAGLLNARTVEVGSCLSGLKQYPTISAAIAAVPPGSTIKVCPATYSEQITISQSLTLTGVTTGNGFSVIIQGPTADVFSQYLGSTVHAQILVNNGASVNITNLTVDGTGICSEPFANVYYAQSSGTLNHVVIRNDVQGGVTQCGTGAWIENDVNNPLTTTIQNSSLYNLAQGVLAVSESTTASLAANVTSNFFNSLAGAAIHYWNATGTASHNVSSNALYGAVTENSTVVTISGNTFIGAGAYAISLGSNGNTVTGNQLFSNPHAIVVSGNNNTIQGNKITSNNLGGNEMGIVGGCSSSVTGNTISGNTITDLFFGIYAIPPGNTVTNNTYYDVGTTVYTCQ
jgi:parallel beta-helix repeat protein